MAERIADQDSAFYTSADHLTVLTAPARLARQRRDAWAEYWRTRQRIGARAFSAAVGRSR
ncbi:MAG: hypothetical protein HYU53_02305 [Acidobacteria bacterium]|nr:hypothetical protein [Acidobacteriota bacterium]